MNEMERLRHLLSHWMEHNVEHARTYAEWADKAQAEGNERLSGILRSIASETEKMNGLFREAQEAIEGV
jgi:hypothetical protein